MYPNGGINLICPKCGYEEIGEISSNENIKQKKEREKGVVDVEKELSKGYDNICKKCGFNKAIIIERPPHISDEDSLTYLRCGKCGFTEDLTRKPT
jgi:DNA-directed RNA polymerase subunit M/transcription elongation factor TFIIS